MHYIILERNLDNDVWVKLNRSLKGGKAMLGLRERHVDRVARAEIAELERIAAIPFPVAKIPPRLIEAQKRGLYDEVAQSVGFVPAELVRVRLLEFFEQEGIELYDYNQVKAWLVEKKKQAKAKHWCWRALREKDIITSYVWGYDRAMQRWNDGFYSSTNRKWECRPYDRMVPLHALLKVAKIEAEFGDCVKFFVSDYAAPDVDPFIMVRPTMCDSGDHEYRLVFDVWDEPGFGV